VAELLPRFRQTQAEAARQVTEASLEAGEAPPDSNGRVLRRSADGHNRERARGIPIVGRVSRGGAIPGTEPLPALLQKEARDKRR
jgi:hypothetical protein